MAQAVALSEGHALSFSYACLSERSVCMSNSKPPLLFFYCVHKASCFPLYDRIELCGCPHKPVAGFYFCTVLVFVIILYVALATRLRVMYCLPDFVLAAYMV